MEKKIIKWFFGAVGLGLCILLIIAFTTNSVNSAINNEQVTPFNEGWLCTVHGGEAKQVTLPVMLDENTAPKGQAIRITNTLPEKYTEGMTICFRSVHQFVRVLVEGKVVYEYGYSSTQKIGKSPGNSWNFIRFGKDTAGKEIAIELESPYERNAGVIDEINYGSKNSNVFHIIEQNILNLFISALIIFIGLFMLAVYVFFIKERTSIHMVYLGSFAILAGVWSLTETTMMQFFISTPFAVTVLAYFCLGLLNVPLLLFISSSHSIHNQRAYRVTGVLFIAVTVTMMLLQLFNITDVSEFPYLIHGLLAFSAALIIYTVFVEIIKYKNKQMYFLGAGSCVLALSSVMGFIWFYGKVVGDNATFFRWAVLFYILNLCYYTIKNLIAMASENMENKVLETLAYIDLLTGLKNRTSFELEMERYRENPEACVGLSMGICDVNNLKLVNDTYGHKEGDRHIKFCARYLEEAIGSAGRVYRTGGDEFAVMMSNSNQQEIARLLSGFEQTIKQHNTQTDITLSVAWGCATFDRELDSEADSLYVRADEAMYARKIIMKGFEGRRKEDRIKSAETM